MPMLAVMAAASCGKAPPVIHRFGGMTMGSTYEVKFIGEVPLVTVQAAVVTLLDEFDQMFSKWRPDSEISRLNASPAATPFAVSARFAAVLGQALDLA